MNMGKLQSITLMLLKNNEKRMNDIHHQVFNRLKDMETVTTRLWNSNSKENNFHFDGK